MYITNNGGCFDWIDLGGALKQARSVGNPGAKIIHCSLDQMLHNGMHMDYQNLPPIDVPMMANPEAVVTDLLEALGRATLFLLPVMIFTILLRKHLLRGITFGAVRK